MIKYDYRAKDATGKTLRGYMFAENLNDFYAKLREQGLFCVSVSEAASGASEDNVGEALNKGGRKLGLKEVSIFCRQFATMINAGLTVIKCLDILYRQTQKKRMKQIMLDMYESIKKGNPLSQALKEQGKAFPQLMISMIESGEAGGNIDEVLLTLSDHFEKENRINGKVKTAMIYPIVLLCVTVGVVIILMTFVMPKFFETFGDQGNLPGPTKVIMAISNSFKSGWYIYILVLGLLVFGIIMAKSMPKVRFAFDHFKVKMPLVGKLLATIYTGRFARTVSSLYKSGVPLIESVRIAGNTLGNAYINSQMQLVIDDIKQGVTFSKAITRANIFPPMFCSMVFIGEESGSLDEILEKTANFYDVESETAINKLVGLLEPMMIVIMGLIVGFVVVSIAMPMFQSYDNIDT